METVTASDIGEESALDSGTLFDSLSPVARRQLTARCTPVHLPADEWLLRQGDEGDTMFVLESGRLEVIAEGSPPKVLKVLRPGSAFGELALLTGRPRVASVRAVRDSVLSRLDRERFFELFAQDPSFALALARTLAHLVEGGAGGAAPTVASRVVAVVLLQDDLPAGRLLDELRRSLEQWGSVATLGEEQAGDLAAAGQDLDRFEREHPHVLLVVGPGADPSWERFCLRQADRVLAISRPDMPAARHRAALRDCDLAVVQEEQQDHGAPSAEPLVEALAPLRRHLVSMDHRFADDVARLARRLSGRSTGLVLSGGGARGLAHIGVLEVLIDAGITIDRIGGCSMGAFVGALFAMGRSPKEIADVCREELVKRRPFNDYTIPRVSLIRAHKAEAMMRRVFGEVDLDDLRLDFFCVSAEMLRAEVMVHRHGPLPEAVGASMSVPGLVPPLALGGRLLVDGGVLNNLPVDVMAAIEEGPVIAVDVMSRRMATAAAARAAVRSGYRRWLLPWKRGDSSSQRGMPRIVETLLRVAVLGSWRVATENRARAALVIAPEVTDIGLFEFERLDAAVEAGRVAARAALRDAPSLVGA